MQLTPKPSPFPSSPVPSTPPPYFPPFPFPPTHFNNQFLLYSPDYVTSSLPLKINSLITMMQQQPITASLQSLSQLTSKQIYNMSSLSRQFQSMKRAMRSDQLRKADAFKYRTVNTIKWKILMLDSLDKLALSPQYDRHLLDDLRTVINKIPEEKFIEAILNLQPYKPNFKMSYQLSEPKHTRKNTRAPKFQLSPNKDLQDETTTVGSILRRNEDQPSAKQIKRKQELIAMFIEDDMLSREISSPNHPYTKIIEGYTYILQNKYKIIIGQQLQSSKLMTVEKLVEKLAQDFKIIENFFKMTSVPIIDIFNLNDQKEKQRYTEEVNCFMLNFLRDNEKIGLSFRKIIRYHVKHSKEVQQFAGHCPVMAEIQNFSLPQKFQIEGCFVYTTSEIINFTELSRGKPSLSKLAAIREAIYKDIDQYYKNDEKNGAMEVSSEIQLEILKFSLVKLQIFAGEILSQLKLLEVLYGQEEISYHFDEASYIHSQLTIAFEAIQHNL